MKKNWVNDVHVEGYIFSIEENGGRNKLQKAETGPASKNPGTPYIRGVINVLTDDEGTNVVPVYFSYVTETYSSGKPNETYKILSQIIEEDAAGTLKTYEGCGSAARKVRIDGDVEINDFQGRDGEMIAAKRVRGSFVHFADSGCRPGATFETDMLISSTALREVEDGDDYMQLNGYVFNFRGDILPVTFSIEVPEGIKFFEDQDVSSANPLLINLWGDIKTTVVVNEQAVESAFGAPKVNTTTRSFRTWNVSGCSSEVMEFDDDSTITKAELKTKLEERAARVAAEKARVEEYQKSRGTQSAFGGGAAAPAKAASPIAADDFPF